MSNFIPLEVNYKNTNNVEAARTADELQKIQQLVAAAVGTDEARGDSVVVQTMPFERPQVAEPTAATWFEKNKALVLTAIKYGSLIAVALLLLLFVIRPARKALKAASSLPEPVDPKLLNASTDDLKRRELEDADMMNLPPMTVAEIEEKMRNGNVINEIEPTVEKEDAPPNIETIRTKLMEQALIEPELVAGTLRGWLRD